MSAIPGGRGRIVGALARHAPDVRVVDVPDTDTGAMDRVVTEAAALARPGGIVPLAPAGASFDRFAGPPGRGAAFIAAVHGLAGGPDAPEAADVPDGRGESG